MIALQAALARLSTTRPVFHSEADFQHALAWDLHEHYPEASVRLEFRPPLMADHVCIDLWLTGPTYITAIELKYKTRPLQTEVNGETFQLRGIRPKISAATTCCGTFIGWKEYRRRIRMHRPPPCS
jgi:hypothetical protein